MSPQQAAGAPPCVRDDVYAVGALLYFALTGVDPAQAPRPDDLLAQPPAADPGTARARIVEVISRALAADPAARYADMTAMGAALAGIRPRATVRTRSCAPPAGGARDENATFAAAARAVAALLRRPFLDGATDRFAGSGTPLGLDTGLAGVVLGLCGVAATEGDPSDREALTVAARSLAEARVRQDRPVGEPATGLYTGEAGIGTALLSAGQFLHDASLMAVAAELAETLAGCPVDCADLFAGTAGRVRFHLWAWAATGTSGHRRAAEAAGSALLATQSAGAWPGPTSYGHLTGRPYLGYARGAAGVADALLDLYEVTGDDRLLAGAARTARLLAAVAECPVPAGQTTVGSGIQWRTVRDGSFFGPYWCHGAAGVGQFLLHADRHGATRSAGELAGQAAESVARARWGGPGQCHGLAGSIEFLLDAYHHTGDARLLAQARELGRLLLGYLPATPGAPAATLPIGYMFGLAGVLVALLRLARPSRPRQLAGDGPCSPAWRGSTG
jgi:lantibiotic modifying enzyme